jgi:uncharacterized membrane protein
MEQAYELVEQYFVIAIKWCILLCEIIGVLIIVLTAIRGLIAWLRRKSNARLIAAEGIAVALTFKLGGEVMRSVIVREWSELLILGAVVLLRAVMAILIHFEIRAEKQLLGAIPEDKKREQKDKPPLVRL